MTEFEIRLIQAGDAVQCAELVAQTYEWESIQQALDEEVNLCFCDYLYHPYAFVAVKDGKIVGYVMAFYSFITGHTYSIRALTVNPDHRRKGLATALMKAIESHIIEHKAKNKSCSLMLVARDNPDIYTRMGYSFAYTLHHGKTLMLKNIEAQT